MHSWTTVALLLAELCLFLALLRVGSRQALDALMRDEPSPGDPWVHWMLVAQCGWLAVGIGGLIWLSGGSWTEAERMGFSVTVIAGAAITSIVLCWNAWQAGKVRAPVH